MKRDFENFFFLQGTPRLNERQLELHKEKKCNFKTVIIYGTILQSLLLKLYLALYPEL